MAVGSMNPADRWVEEQLFEEDVRAVLMMMRPHRRERLQGWSEYRTGGAHFRVTISWDDQFAAGEDQKEWRVPRMAEVLETILMGTVNSDDEMMPEEEFALYRSVAHELCRRIDEMQECYT